MGFNSFIASRRSAYVVHGTSTLKTGRSLSWHISPSRSHSFLLAALLSLFSEDVFFIFSLFCLFIYLFILWHFFRQKTVKLHVLQETNPNKQANKFSSISWLMICNITHKCISSFCFSIVLFLCSNYCIVHLPVWITLAWWRSLQNKEDLL